MSPTGASEAAARRARLAGALLAACAASLLAGCQTIETRESVARTFDYGQALLPPVATRDGGWVKYRGALLADRAFVSEETPDAYRELTGSWLDAAAQRIRPGTRWPVVVFLHGCMGYVHYSVPFAETLLEAGAIVVMPNSFARPGRISRCDGGNMDQRELMREEEARYAAEMLRAQPWVDPARLVLAGQSEGAQATAAYSGGEFTAHIITGTNCRHNGGGVSAPAGTAVLAIKGGNDKTYDGGRCRIGNRDRGSASLVIPAGGHLVFTSGEATLAIHEFLRACCGIGDGIPGSVATRGLLLRNRVRADERATR